MTIVLPKIGAITEPNYPRCLPRNSIVHGPFLWASVCILLALSLPFAIIWLIAFIVVYSSYRHPLWSWTHVSKKILKHIPSLADLNPSASIIFISNSVWIHATLTHGTPRYVLRRSGKPMAEGGHV